ncbi:MAG: immune inhibitor A [Chloroflexi bacterium]|nr:immune inhibitor A [Chloroflexota bacterium]
MPKKTIILILALALATTLRAQGPDYPTLDALANLQIPSFDYGDVVSRLYWIDADHEPPSSPAQVALGDRETFWLPAGAAPGEERYSAELRGMTDSVLLWVLESVPYSHDRAQSLAERVSAEVIRPLQALFDYAEPPGVDGDPRLIIVMMQNPAFPQAGIFAKGHALPRQLNEISNEREMLVVNRVFTDGSLLDDNLLIEVIAHEFQHILLHHRDANEELWLNEAFSSFAQFHKRGLQRIETTTGMFLAAPQTGLTMLRAGDNLGEKYGAGALFAVYLAQRFGDDLIARLHAESLDGWRGIDKVLRTQHNISADEVFADWTLANYFQAHDRGYGYADPDKVLRAVQPVHYLRAFPAMVSGSLPQYSTDYFEVNVRDADQLSLQLTQMPEAKLFDAAAKEGDYVYYGVTAASADSRLTRELDLQGVSSAWLEFSIWHDLVSGREYAYVEVSTDGGKTWSVLSGEHTAGGESWLHSDGYTGKSNGWLQERINLRYFIGRRILLRFEVVSDNVTNYRGMAIDDLRIDAIDFHDGFEAPDDAWVAEGWLRTDNRLPQNTWLQVVQETDSGLHLERYLVTGTQQVDIDVLLGATRAVIAVSPIVPQTALETEYSLTASLIDAQGNVMEVSRDCTVTTTTGLNFRDAPNGNKIGLITQGRAVDALDKSGDWFQVDHDGTLGWIHAGYVTTTGNCP